MRRAIEAAMCPLPLRLSPTGELPLPPRAYVEFRVAFVVGSLAEYAADMRDRLDGVERTLARLISRWSAGAPLAVARDVRMSPATLDELTAWIQGGETVRAGLFERLGIYHSGAIADAGVPRGWIRVYLGLGRRDDGPAQAHGG